MSNVTAGFSMSLDGFIADPDDNTDRVFKWYSTGNTDLKVPSGDRTFKLSPESAAHFEEATRTVGALIYGRKTFDVAHAWGGRHPLDVPMIILTHKVPQEWVKAGSPFIFVTDGIENAVAQARKVAGDKTVAVGSATTTQQCLKAGLLDNIHIDLVPVLLGDGVRLFDQLGVTAPDLECLEVVATHDVIHLTYRIIK